jgi:hypothetical protein
MNGDQNSRLDERNTLLDNIEKQLGLIALPKEPNLDKNEINKIMELSRTELEALSTEDCEYGSYLVSQYSMFVQRHINRLNAIKIWAENELKQIVASAFDTHTGPWEMREPKIVNENSAAKKLKDMSIFAEQQLARLDNIPRRLDALSSRLDGLKFSKIRENKSNNAQIY